MCVAGVKLKIVIRDKQYIDEEALAELSKSHESSERLAMTVFKEAVMKPSFSSWWTIMLIKHKTNYSNVDKAIRCVESRKKIL